MPSLEITTMIGCPLMCSFCPQEQLRGAYGKDSDKYMTVDNFKTILSTVPDYVRIDFSGMAEPWANAGCTDMLQYALERGHHIGVYTTLYGIEVKDADRILDLLGAHAPQVEVVCLHLPDAKGNMRGWRTSAEYGKVLVRFMNFGQMGLVHVEAMTMDRRGSVHPRIRSYVGELAEWTGLTRAGSLDLAEIGDQPVEETPRYETPVACSYTPFYDQNVVLPNGDVVLCCMDYGMKNVIGNLLTGNYWALFNSDSMLALKAENQRCGNAGTSICKSCTRATVYSIGQSHHAWLDNRTPPKMVTEDLKTWDAWRRIHQPFELDWWKDVLPSGHSDDPGFTLAWNEVKAFILPELRDATLRSWPLILDVGCGPRPPFAPCTVIEPLANSYKQFVSPEWWAMVKVYAQPAEQFVPELTAEFDVVICWNAIDHTIGWRIILDNMLAYGAPEARFAIATDFHDPYIGHPGFTRAEFMAEIDARFNIHDQREPFGREMALLMTAK
jgi:hypothetical protein